MTKCRNTPYAWSLLLILTPFILCCHKAVQKDAQPAELSVNFNNGTFGYDAEFLRKHHVLTVLLKDSTSDACVLIAPGLQGRVMTSSVEGDTGISFGWINHRLFDSSKTNDQFNPYGGEERLWLGPEGGPFSIYFKQDAEQVFENWKVPAELDTEPFEIVEQDVSKISFKKDFILENYSGTNLDIGIERNVRILNREEIEKYLGIAIDTSVKSVAYQSDNVLINKGDNEWNKGNGFLSLWMLSMFKPTEKGVVFIPFRAGTENKLGRKVNDDYFGEVPADRLQAGENILFFKVDGKYRSKIGISPSRALPYCGSYDPGQNILTVLWYSKPDQIMDYVNSKWGSQTNPLKGDVINSYNDGPVEDGSVMGPFYEIESSSPAALLKPGGKIQHSQRIYHFTGTQDRLNPIVQALFGITIESVIKSL